MRACLEAKRVGPDTIDEVVEELCETGALDDASFTERFVHDKRELAGWGPERIGQELARRGVPPELIEPALATRERGDELAAACALLESRFSGQLDDDRARNRAWQLLVRRGYEPELAYDAVRAHDRAA